MVARKPSAVPIVHLADGHDLASSPSTLSSTVNSYFRAEPAKRRFEVHADHPVGHGDTVPTRFFMLTSIRSRGGSPGGRTRAGRCSRPAWGPGRSGLLRGYLHGWSALDLASARASSKRGRPFRLRPAGGRGLYGQVLVGYIGLLALSALVVSKSMRSRRDRRCIHVDNVTLGDLCGRRFIGHEFHQ
jgi:hypothetical protein